MTAPRLALAALTAAAVSASGCGGNSAEHVASVPSATVRDCSMVGYGGLAPDYRRRALVLGPLALGDLRTHSAREPLPSGTGGRYGAYKVIAIVNAGAKPTLSLPRSEWSTVGLLYDPAKFREDGAYSIGELDQVVHFRACRSRHFNHGVSQFDGGFVVSHSQCVHFLVSTPDGRTYRGEFPAAAACRRQA